MNLRTREGSKNLRLLLMRAVYRPHSLSDESSVQITAKAGYGTHEEKKKKPAT